MVVIGQTWRWCRRRRSGAEMKTGPQTHGQPLEEEMKRGERDAQEHTPASSQLPTKACPSPRPLRGGCRCAREFKRGPLCVRVCVHAHVCPCKIV